MNYDVAVNPTVNPMGGGSHRSFGVRHCSCYGIVFPEIMVQNYDIVVQLARIQMVYDIILVDNSKHMIMISSYVISSIDL